MTYQTPRPPEPSFGAGPAATPPQSINMAKMAMYAGAVLSLISLFVNPSKEKIKAELLKEDSTLDLSAVDTAANVGWWLTIVLGILGALIWVWMAMANSKGKSWARILSTVLFGLATISLIYGFTKSGATTAGGQVVSVLTWLAGAAAVFFLWRKDASDFFAARSAK